MKITPRLTKTFPFIAISPFGSVAGVDALIERESKLLRELSTIEHEGKSKGYFAKLPGNAEAWISKEKKYFHDRLDCFRKIETLLETGNPSSEDVTLAKAANVTIKDIDSAPDATLTRLQAHLGAKPKASAERRP